MRREIAAAKRASRGTRDASRKDTRNRESGYALLLIFAMAAIVALNLYMEIPRAAFEAQRDKEQMLIDRGHEYSRAVALFVHKFNRFPASMDELENTNNQRFLRRRFEDPMTGKADWRILHAGPGGMITDSVIKTQKPEDTKTQQTFITQLQMFGEGPTANADAGVNMATRVRPSDQAGAAGNVNNGGAASGDPGSSSAGNSILAGYNGPVMVLPDGRIVPANITGTAPPPPGAPGATGATGNTLSPAVPGLPPGVAGPMLPNGVAIQQQQIQQQLGTQAQQFQNMQNGQNTPQIPPQGGGPPQPGGPPNGAASLINQILTSPRPGGINGLQGAPGTPGQGSAQPFGAPAATTTTAGPAAPQQQVIGAGIAGVASKREQEGIKTYNDHTKYNEWEFVYDVSKDPMKAGQRGGAVGAAGAPGGTGAQGNANAPGQSGFGSSSGFGGSSGFGSSSPGGGQSGFGSPSPGMGGPGTPPGTGH